MNEIGENLLTVLFSKTGQNDIYSHTVDSLGQSHNAGKVISAEVDTHR